MNDNDISNYLFNKSIEIEPRYCKQIPKFPRKWPNLSLKSPSSKLKSSRQSVSSSTGSSGIASSNASSIASLLTQKSSSATITTSDEAVKSGDDSSQKSDNSDFSIFAAVQIPTTGQNSPTLSPASPAPTTFANWAAQQNQPAPPPIPHHNRSQSVCSINSAQLRMFNSAPTIPPPPIPDHMYVEIV